MPEFTPEQQAEIDSIRSALEAEFARSEDATSRQSAKKDLEDIKPDLLAALSHVVNHGTEANRAKVAMWGYEKLLDEGKADRDPLKQLLEGMPAPKSGETTPTTSEG